VGLAPCPSLDRHVVSAGPHSIVTPAKAGVQNSPCHFTQSLQLDTGLRRYDGVGLAPCPSLDRHVVSAGPHSIVTPAPGSCRRQARGQAPAGVQNGPCHFAPPPQLDTDLRRYDGLGLLGRPLLRRRSSGMTRGGYGGASVSIVTPAKAGVQNGLCHFTQPPQLDTGLRRYDGEEQYSALTLRDAAFGGPQGEDRG